MDTRRNTPPESISGGSRAPAPGTRTGVGDPGRLALPNREARALDAEFEAVRGFLGEEFARGLDSGPEGDRIEGHGPPTEAGDRGHSRGASAAQPLDPEPLLSATPHRRGQFFHLGAESEEVVETGVAPKETPKGTPKRTSEGAPESESTTPPKIELEGTRPAWPSDPTNGSSVPPGSALREDGAAARGTPLELATLGDAIRGRSMLGPDGGSRDRASIRTLLERLDSDPRASSIFRETWDEADSVPRTPSGAAHPPVLRPGPLAGLPIAIKSNLAVAGRRLECGSHILEGYRAPYTATAVDRLRSAGMVPIATTHMDEFAMGARGDACAFASPRNPWDASRVPGGSSSGSAIAVALGYVPAALGSDTGGSVRIPAARCGVTGFRPSYGRISRHGLVAHASSMDQVGLIARDARGVAELFEAVSGHDPLDATSLLTGPVPATDSLPRPGGLRGLRIARLEPNADPHPGVRAALDDTLEVLRDLGAQVIDLELPILRASLPTYLALSCIEAASNLARYDGLRYGPGHDMGGDGVARVSDVPRHRAAKFGPEVRRRIRFGSELLRDRRDERFLERTRGFRADIRARLVEALSSHDLIVTPTSDDPAPPRIRTADLERTHGGDLPGVSPESLPESIIRGLADDRWTLPASLAGLPAISIPAGRLPGGGAGWPIGIQLIGRPLDDALVLRVAQDLQARTRHHLAAPPGALDPPWMP